MAGTANDILVPPDIRFVDDLRCRLYTSKMKDILPKTARDDIVSKFIGVKRVPFERLESPSNNTMVRSTEDHVNELLIKLVDVDTTELSSQLTVMASTNPGQEVGKGHYFNMIHCAVYE